MKKSVVLLGFIAAMAFVSCEKKTTTTLNEDGGSTTVETVGFDKQRIDSTAEKVEDGAQKAAKKNGEALEDAGESIKEGAKKTGDKIEKATDGDGDANQ